jgi:hypothetical protein
MTPSSLKNQLFGAVAALATGTLAAASIVLLGCGHESAASPTALPPAAALVPAPAVEPAPTPPEAAAEPTAPAADPVASKPQPAETAAPSERPAGQRPPADRTPTRPGEAEKISFDDLNLGMPADVVYRPFMLSDRAKELDGKRVSIMGYIYGAQLKTTDIKEFILLKNTECKYGPKGQADHLAKITLRKDKSTDYKPSAIKVEGTLKIDVETGVDGNTWSIYRLDDAVVK